MTGPRRAIRVRTHIAPAAGGAGGSRSAHPTCFPGEIPVFYDMYPEWGPASHDPANPLSVEAVQVALDLRDNGGLRPDDN